MYEDFYGFSERPFDVNPDPKFLYLTESHREALASMLYGIKERRGFIAVTGEVGTGKTTLVNALLNSLNEHVTPVHIFRKCNSFSELLRTINYELGVTFKGKDRFALWQRLNEHLLGRAKIGQTVVLILDEAQNLSKRMLEEIRTLSNLETQKTKLLQIMLVGQPELEIKLNSAELRQLRQRISIRRTLRPLRDGEVEAYIKHRLRLVGGVIYSLFTSDALSLITRYSRGIPRVVNILCDNAFLIGYALKKKKIDGAIIREVIRDLEAEIPASRDTREGTVVFPIRGPVSGGDGWMHVLKDFFSGLWGKKHGRPTNGAVNAASTAPVGLLRQQKGE